MVRERIDAWAGSSLGVLLIGQDEVTYEHALYACSKALSCTVEELNKHPDFTLISSEKGLKVEDLEPVSERVTNYARRADKSVVLIRSIDRASKEVPHKILKALEESGNAIFVLTSGENVLDTIRSRCLVIECASKFKYEADTESIALLGAAGSVDDELKNTLNQVKDAILEGEVLKLFDILHLTKEKDKDNFVETRKGDLDKVFNVLMFVLTDILLYTTSSLGGVLEPLVAYDTANLKDAINFVAGEKKRLSKPYTKDDFFVFLAKFECLLN